MVCVADGLRGAPTGVASPSELFVCGGGGGSDVGGRDRPPAGAQGSGSGSLSRLRREGDSLRPLRDSWACVLPRPGVAVDSCDPVDACRPVLRLRSLEEGINKI